MEKTSNPIVFFGSGPVAAESLRLLAQDFNIEAVVTKPRPPHHHGDVPVLALAAKLHLPIHTVNTKKDLRELCASRPFAAQLAILIDFGVIVPQEVIDYFPLGIINSHFSLLPEWRGADPITFSILSGQEQTGVSLMFLVEAMDEGPLLAYGAYNIPKDTTTPRLTDELIKLSDTLLKQEIPRYVAAGHKVAGTSQDITKRKASYSRKLTKDDSILDWNKPAVQLEREIRAFIEWPKSRTTLGGKEIIITKAYAMPGTAPGAKPGDVTAAKEAGAIAVATSDGSLWIERLKPSGKREMSTREFLAGNKL